MPFAFHEQILLVNIYILYESKRCMNEIVIDARVCVLLHLASSTFRSFININKLFRLTMLFFSLMELVSSLNILPVFVIIVCLCEVCGKVRVGWGGLSAGVALAE